MRLRWDLQSRRRTTAAGGPGTLCAAVLAAAFVAAPLTGCGKGGGGGGGADASMKDASTDALPDPDGGVPGCNPMGDPEPELTTCSDDLPEPPAEGTCTVEPGAGGATLLIGQVLTPGEVLRGGEVLVDGDGMIQCVGCDCSGETGADAATRVVCPQGVISPGLINGHDHVPFNHAHPYNRTDERYEHRHDWRTGRRRGHTEVPHAGSAARDDDEHRVAWSELRQLISGTTSVNGSGGSSGFLRNLDRASLLEDLDQPAVNYSTFPLDDVSGTVQADSCEYGSRIDTTEDIAGDDAYTPHIAEGIDQEARNEFLCLRDAMEGLTDLIEPQTGIVHGIGLLPQEIAEMSAEGSSLIWSPRTNITLYGDTARVTEYDQLGVRIALGTDWSVSGSMNMLRELRCAASFNEGYLAGYFSDERLWLMATRDAAAALAVDDAIGELAPGLVADIAIFDAAERQDHRAVIEADAEDVALVMRGGEALFGDASVLEQLGGGDCDTMDVCGAQKRACVMRETGASLADLQGSNSSSYDLFFCETPEGEPSCTPERTSMGGIYPDARVEGSNLYSGERTGEDRDGDGIPDAMDNCPCTFNPIRPVDDGKQADTDGDGIGDACDPCPFDEGSTECSGFSPDDRDGDGIDNAEDNCPSTHNPDQQDTDGDGKGDACDPCPERPNPGDQACPGTVYEVKDGTLSTGTTVSIRGPVVTAVSDSGFFMQVPPSSDEYDGTDYSGVFVYTGEAPPVNRGDRLELSTARINDYFGQLQLTDAAFSVLESDQPIPEPVAVSAAEVGTDGGRAEALEGVLVRVEDVTVTDVAPEPGPGDSEPTNEIEVDDALRVDDMLFLIEPFPTEGEMFAAISGVIALNNEHSKLLPRDADDIEAGMAQLADLDPGLSYVRQGDPAGPTFPEPLTVRLTRPASADTTVTLDAGAGLSVSNVTIPEGSTTAEVQVEGMTASPTPYEVTATLGDAEAFANVRVLEPEETPGLEAVRPGAATVPVGGTATFAVKLTIPAPTGGTEVALSVDMNGTVPGSVTVPADALEQEFMFEADEAEGMATITATLGDDIATANVTISNASSFVINEVDYDQPGADAEEFVELFNGSAEEVDLDAVAVVFVNGATDEEYRRVELSGTLEPGEYLVLANDAVSVPEGVTKITIPDSSVQNGDPDGIALVDTVAGTLLDALSYGGSITEASIDGFDEPVSLVEGTPTSASDSSSAVRSIARLPNGVDTDDADADWGETDTPTPGTENM